MRLMMIVLGLNFLHRVLQGRKSYPHIWRPQITQVPITKPPRSPCLDSDRRHAQGLRRDKIRDFALVYLFSE